MDSAFLKMATGDETLIKMMKEIISYQRSKNTQREKLLIAIVRNVKYLANLHVKNTADLTLTKERLSFVDKMNGELQE